MRKWIFLIVLSITSYCYLLAQQNAVNGSLVQNYQPNDVYKIEVIRPAKTGYALQVASFSSYPNVLKFATSLQAKSIRNILLRLDETNKDKPIYKILVGPFASRQQALNYQQQYRLTTGFVTSLAQRTAPAVQPPTPPSRQENFSTKGQTSRTLFSQVGEASYYSEDFHGRITANGETFDMNALTAAHWTLPFGTPLKVCRLDNGKCVQVRVNDRGPNPAKAIARDGKPRIIDLSFAAAQRIGLVQAGLAQVRIEQLDLTPINVENTTLIEKGTNNANIPAALPTSSNSATTQIGEASYYAQKFHGRTTASGEIYDMHALTAAHWTLPFNTRLKVCRIDNGKCVQVRVSDRGPNPAKAFARDGQPRIIDLSFAAAQRIGLVQAGVTQVRIELLK